MGARGGRRPKPRPRQKLRKVSPHPTATINLLKKNPSPSLVTLAMPLFPAPKNAQPPSINKDQTNTNKFLPNAAIGPVVIGSTAQTCHGRPFVP